MANKFKVGDMVIGNEKANVYRITGKGVVATVIGIYACDIKIKVEKAPSWAMSDTFFVDPDCFDLYIPHEGKILIMVDEKDPNKVIARDLITKKTAEAKCNPKDEWDFAKGAKLALERLYPEKKEEEKPKYWSGKVVCINNYEGNKYFTAGKVYAVNDGKLFDNEPPIPYMTEISSVEDINTAIKKSIICPSVEFIEFKGEA